MFFCFSDNTVILVNPGVGDKLQVSNTDEMLKAFDPTEQQSGTCKFILFLGE